jgi:hypothetical protein
MTSYRFELKKCPDCKCKFTRYALMSCNSIGATVYTDGFMEGSMYDSDSAILRCPKCCRFFWGEDVPTLKEMLDFDYFSKSRRGGRIATKVDGKDYEGLLRQEFWRNEDQEKYLRIRAWWSFNDEFRHSASDGLNFTDEFEINLQRLLSLLDSNNPVELIKQAEIYRELGRFDECLKLLDKQVDVNYVSAKNIIMHLADCKIRRVVAVVE